MIRFLLFVVTFCGVWGKTTAQNLVFTKIPLPSQLFQRNIATNQADVLVAGSCPSWTQYVSIEFRLSDENGLIQTVKNPLVFVGTSASFSFSGKINAAKNNHSIEVFGQKVANGPYFLEKKVEKLLGGDIFIINGQSNAIALASPFPSDINEYTRSWTTNYGWGPLNLSFPGQWGARLANRIATDLNIPVAIFNGAIGASKIADLLPMPGNTTSNYAQLLSRMEQAGTEKKARAAFYFQGEADGWETSIADYKSRFLSLKNAWKADYNIEKAFLFQMRYQSCTAEKPFVLEAQRQLGRENSDIDAMSTTNADHDGCHFVYENGYKSLGDRLFSMVANQFYGKNFADANPPDVSKAYFETPTTLVLEFGNAANLLMLGYPWLDFRVEGEAIGISGGVVLGNKIKLTLNSATTNLTTGISYLGHSGNANHWIINPASVGLLAFYNFPISGAPTPTQVDLNIASASIPATIQAGAGGSLSFVFKNIGTANGAGNTNFSASLSTDNLWSINDLSLGSSSLAVPNMGATANGSFNFIVPANQTAGNYFIILKGDSGNQIAESNENNNEFSAAISITVAPGPTVSGVDLELSATTTDLQPTAFSTASVQFLLKNKGNISVTNVVVGLNLEGKLVYKGGNESVVSQGVFAPFSGIWSVGTVAAGQSATLTVNLFTLDLLLKKVFSQVTGQGSPDLDSQPGNGSIGAAIFQDDEFLVKLNSSNQPPPPPTTGNYCQGSSNYPWEDWIERVEIGQNLNQSSGKSTYTFYNNAVNLVKNTPLSLNLTGGYSYFTFDEFWQIWVDGNQNKVFEPAEQIFQGKMLAPPNGVLKKSYAGNLIIPATALDGLTRMRVSMSRNAIGNACDTLKFGEIEDYLIQILPNLNNPNDNRSVDLDAKSPVFFQISPNPAGDFVVISMDNLVEKSAIIRVTDQFGKLILEEKTTRVAQSIRLLDCSDWPTGLYFVQLESENYRPLTRKLVVQRSF